MLLSHTISKYAKYNNATAVLSAFCKRTVIVLKANKRFWYNYRFRLSIISHSPNLKFLDDRHVTAEERRAVHHMTSGVVVHSTMEQHGRHLPVVSYPTMETKLMPKSDADFNSGHSSKVRYHYLGKHSEGNRFITNQDL